MWHHLSLVVTYEHIGAYSISQSSVAGFYQCALSTAPTQLLVSATDDTSDQPRAAAGPHHSPNRHSAHSAFCTPVYRLACAPSLFFEALQPVWRLLP